MITEAVKSLNPLPNVPLTMALTQSTSTPAALPLRIATNIFQDQTNPILKPTNSEEINVGGISKTNTTLTTGSSSSIMANNTTQGSSSFDLSKAIQNGSSDSNSCNICHKAFSNHEVLKKHIKSHILNTSSHCAACGQDFPDRLALAKHQTEVHSTERVFQCPQCEKGFKELRTLRLHLKIHNAEYPEQCNVCQKVFRTKWQLKQHQMDHGGERPYPCPECAFTCKTKQQLNEHRRKHSGEKAYSCTQCNTRFTYRNGLIKHTKLNRCPKKNHHSRRRNYCKEAN
jgi:uncharacterized Zn-finger protein